MTFIFISKQNKLAQFLKATSLSEFDEKMSWDENKEWLKSKKEQLKCFLDWYKKEVEGELLWKKNQTKLLKLLLFL